MENKNFKVVFENLSTEDIEKYIQLAEEEIYKRKEKRKKELWGNVIASLRKYEDEIGAIFVDNGDGEDFTITSDIERLGMFYI